MSVQVVSIGTMAVDYFGLVPDLDFSDGKIKALGYEYHAGGVAGNVITQLSRLGATTGWIGKLGDDQAGRLLLAECERHGIDTSHAEVVKGKNSMFTWILVDTKGNRCITMYPNVLNELTGEDVRRKHAQAIATAHVLMAEACVMPLGPIIEAMKIARENHVKVVFDMDVTVSEILRTDMGTKEQIEKALELCDVFIPCKAAAVELLGSEDIIDRVAGLQYRQDQLISVTLGSAGAISYHQEHLIHVPSFPVNTVDTTGAGDAYHGGFVYGLLKGYDIERSTRFANACGAYCCTGVGARHMGSLDQIEEMFSNT